MALIVELLGEEYMNMKEKFMIVWQHYVCTCCNEAAMKCFNHGKQLPARRKHTHHSGKNRLLFKDLLEIVPEPIDKWHDIGPHHFNILDADYAEPERYAYTFQDYVFVTRVMQEKKSSGGIKPLRLMERSVFSDRMVFVRAVHTPKWMNMMEISIYDSWVDPVVSSLPGLIPDAFIYLRASPNACHKRMMLRKSAEEGGVSLK
ncbi:uncharacterized protein [Rutidosis leptorrhynchoides]|uniref:uncharacterized protein n=1 Tax=Rutidosis leptorrhynchoides TaxID=125765 RepID=UPI003A98FB61